MKIPQQILKEGFDLDQIKEMGKEYFQTQTKTGYYPENGFVRRFEEQLKKEGYPESHRLMIAERVLVDFLAQSYLEI